MDYDEIIRQLTHIADEGDDRWEKEEILKRLNTGKSVLEILNTM